MTLKSSDVGKGKWEYQRPCQALTPVMGQSSKPASLVEGREAPHQKGTTLVLLYLLLTLLFRLLLLFSVGFSWGMGIGRGEAVSYHFL